MKIIKPGHQFIVTTHYDNEDFVISGTEPGDALRRLLRYINFHLSCYSNRRVELNSLDVQISDCQGRAWYGPFGTRIWRPDDATNQTT